MKGRAWNGWRWYGVSLIWDAMSCGRTKGEDESPPERRRTNGDIKSLLRPGTRATGVLCTTAPSLHPLPSRPRVRDFWIHFVTNHHALREISPFYVNFILPFFFFPFLSFFSTAISTASFVPTSFDECAITHRAWIPFQKSFKIFYEFDFSKNREIEMENIRGEREGREKQRFWFWSIGGIEIVASRVICLSSISTPMSILINISKYFTILKKKKKKQIEEISQLWKKRREQYSFEKKKKRRRRRRRRRCEWVSFSFSFFFTPGEIQIFLVEIIIIRASIIGPCKEVSTTRKRRIPAQCFISSACFSVRDWFISRWKARVSAGCAGRYAGLSDCYRVPAERRKRRDEPPTLIHLSQWKLHRRHYPAARYRYRFKVDAADPIHQTILLILRTGQVSFPVLSKLSWKFVQKRKRKKEKKKKTIRYIYIYYNWRKNFTVYFGDVINGGISFHRNEWAG